MTTQRMIPGVAAHEAADTRGEKMNYLLSHHLRLGSVRDVDWVAAHFGHR
jgi:hypothetical protein